HEFLIEVPLKGTFGRAWYQEQLKKPEPQRHGVEQWLRSFREQQQKYRPPGHKGGEVYAAPATGATKELMALAHDLYLLQKSKSLPRPLVRRLRNYKEFQGARYEIAVAAAFEKCGFDIEWITDVKSRHPEFVARNNRTGEEIAVETKSRRRPGALHESGVRPPEDKLRADVEALYDDALEQDPGDKPFAVFLDVNLPPNAAPEETVKWRDEVVGRWRENQQEIALLGFTNFSWHYKAGESVSRPELLFTVPISSARPLRTPETLRCLQVVLASYGVVNNEY